MGIKLTAQEVVNNMMAGGRAHSEKTDTKATPPWLCILPAIPLANGVPIIDVATGERMTCVADPNSRGNTGAWSREREQIVVPIRADAVRIDLNCHLGFGYAVTVFCSARGPTRAALGVADTRARVEAIFEEVGGGMMLIHRWTHVATTNADRMALARVLAEVMS